MMFKKGKIRFIHGLFLIYCLFALAIFYYFNHSAGLGTSSYNDIPLLMIWNIFLAFVAFDAVQLHFWTKNLVIRVFTAFIAFLFYPNTYYMMTDAKHLGDWFPDPTQMDFAQMPAQKIIYFVLLMAGVFFGVFLGFEIIKVILHRYFSKLTTKVDFVLVMSFLSSIAIYAGRVSSQRVNSWDVFYRPLYTLEKLFSVVQPQHFGFLLSFTLFQLFIIGLGFSIVEKDSYDL